MALRRREEEGPARGLDTVDYIKVNYIKLAMGKILDHGAAASFDVSYEKEIFVMERSSGYKPITWGKLGRYKPIAGGTWACTSP